MFGFNIFGKRIIKTTKWRIIIYLVRNTAVKTVQKFGVDNNKLGSTVFTDTWFAWRKCNSGG